MHFHGFAGIILQATAVSELSGVFESVCAAACDMKQNVNRDIYQDVRVELIVIVLK